MNNVSLGLRIAYGALSGLSGTIILGIVLFAGWGILGDALSQEQITVNQFGNVENNFELHPLFHVLVILAIFLSGLSAYITQGLLMSFHFPTKSRKFIISQILFSQIALLTLMLPLYIASTAMEQTMITGITALLHVVLGCLLTFSILDKPSLLRLTGFAFGIILFALIFVIFSSAITPLLLLTLPLLCGLTQMTDGLLQIWYEKASQAYGVDLLEENSSLIDNETEIDDEEVF